MKLQIAPLDIKGGKELFDWNSFAYREEVEEEAEEEEEQVGKEEERPFNRLLISVCLLFVCLSASMPHSLRYTLFLSIRLSLR